MEVLEAVVITSWTAFCGGGNRAISAHFCGIYTWVPAAVHCEVDTEGKDQVYSEQSRTLGGMAEEGGMVLRHCCKCSHE